MFSCGTGHGTLGKMTPGFETLFGRFTLVDNGKLGSTAVTMVITMVNCKKLSGITMETWE